MLVTNHDFVGCQRPTEHQSDAGSGNGTAGYRPAVGGVDFDADCVASGSGMNRGGDRTKRFAQNDVCSAVKQSYDLGVSLDRHCGDGSFCTELDKGDSHFLSERPAARIDEPLDQSGVEIIREYGHEFLQWERAKTSGFIRAARG